jgi:hypothetical protein
MIDDPAITQILENLFDAMPASILDIISGIIIKGPVNIAYLWV